MQLESIGFYTLCDSRARHVSEQSDLWRCELLVTDKCNFRCPYCRGVKPDFAGVLSERDARLIVQSWASHGLHNIRFSGGEPTTWSPLSSTVSLANELGVQRIAISTNGSASFTTYRDLVFAGVNDFSISLDACCASTGDRMAGVAGKWDLVVSNIRALSKLTYVTVGIVITDETAASVVDVIRFAHDLGVADIRIISAAQTPTIQMALDGVEPRILDAHPILAYRIRNAMVGKQMRGIGEADSHRCSLVLDDMAVVGGHHFPCIIYLREGGKPIGKVGSCREMRRERAMWYERHDTHADPICRRNCLDVCVDYNNRVCKLQRDGS